MRHDLAGADATVVERALIEANQNRRHLSKLSQARLALRLFEIERGRKRGDLQEDESDEARDRVGKRLDMSGRHLERYFDVLKTPASIQQAFEADVLPLTMAARVSRLSAAKQEELARRIDAGEEPRQVVSEALHGIKAPVQLLREALAGLSKFVLTIENGMPDDVNLTFRQQKLLNCAKRYVAELLSLQDSHMESERQEMDDYLNGLAAS